MPRRPIKLILVTAEHHPYHKMWINIAKEVSRELGVELEVREEDYIFLTEHGDKDEYGMAWLPQLIVQYDDGSYKVALSNLPLGKDYKPDQHKAVKEALNNTLVDEAQIHH